MDCLTFVSAAATPLRTTSGRTATSSFLSRPIVAAVRPRHAVVRMGAHTSDGGYEIKESEYVDPVGEDGDGGDGFVGKAENDDMLGVSMPDNLASFEIRQIMNSKNRDELVDKLKEIKYRRRGVMEDRRKGQGLGTADDYLKNL